MAAPHRIRVGVPVALCLDAVVVLVFAGIGRASHHESNPVIDALGTAWPFLLGAAIGWLTTRLVARRPPLQTSTGWPVWLCTVAGGMVVRQLIGRGTAFAFVIVATVFLGIFMMGWRLVAGLWSRKAHS